MSLWLTESRENRHMNRGVGPLARSRLPSRLCARKPDQGSGADEGVRPTMAQPGIKGLDCIFDGAVSTEAFTGSSNEVNPKNPSGRRAIVRLPAGMDPRIATD